MSIDIDKEIRKKRCSAALCAIMNYRKVTKAELAKGTGLSYRTLEGYCYGRNDMSSAKAYNIVEIEHYLSVDGRILTGSKSIEDFYDAEKNRLLGKVDYNTMNIDYIMPNSTLTDTIETYHANQDKRMERLSHMMEVYQNTLQKLQNDNDK